MIKPSFKLLLHIVVVMNLVSPAYLQIKKDELADNTIRLSADLVVVDTLVMNKETGLTIENLRKEHFSIYEDGIKQEITHFSQDRLPISILILLDLSSSVQPIIDEICDGALVALHQLKTEDEVGLMVFAKKAKLIQGFTRDRSLVVKRIKTADEASNIGRATYLNDAIYEAASYLNSASNPTSRRLLIAVTDNNSSQPFSKGNSDSEVLERLYESGTVACGLIVRSWKGKIENKTKFLPWRHLYRGNINSYAEKTGGLVINADKTEIQTKLIGLLAKLRSRYTLAYVSSNSRRDGKFRKIKLYISPDVEKREGKTVALGRRGYYARSSEIQ